MGSAKALPFRQATQVVVEAGAERMHAPQLGSSRERAGGATTRVQVLGNRERPF